MSYKDVVDYNRLWMPVIILAVVYLILKFGKSLFSLFGFGSSATGTIADTSVQVVNDATAEIEQGSTDVLANGISYAVFAKNLYDLIYGSGFLGVWKDVNEEALGNMLSHVQPAEYPRLASTYYEYKRAAAPWWQLSSQIYTLSEDIRRTLSAAEIKQYIPLLPL
jgi:hypothetical protein